MAKIKVQNTEITVVAYNDNDYISLTDMARSQMQEHIIFRWLSLKSTLEYIGEWEMLYNPSFNCTEFGTIKNMAGSNNFVLSVKTWIERTGAIGIISKAGDMEERMPTVILPTTSVCGSVPASNCCLLKNTNV